MYKTVRQGENSLQYTILPQTEEVLNNSGLKGKGRDYSPSIHVRRTKKRSTLKCAVLLVFGVVVALALASVPLYVMSTALAGAPPPVAVPQRRATPVVTYGGVTYDLMDATAARARKNKPRLLPAYPPPSSTAPPPESGAATLTSAAQETSAATQTSKTTQLATATQQATAMQHTTAIAAGERRTRPAWSMPAFKMFWKSSSSAPSTLPPAPVVEDPAELNLPNGPFGRPRPSSAHVWGDLDVIIRPTTTPEPRTAPRDVFSYVTRAQAASTTPTGPPEPSPRATFDDVLITTQPKGTPAPSAESHSESGYPLGKDVKEVKESILDDEEDFKEVEAGDTFSLPPLRRKPGGASGDWVDLSDDEVKVTKTTKLRNLWKFDPSSIFQWPDVQQEDSVVVPLLALTVALLAAALALTVAVAIRRHRQNVNGAHIGKLTADLQAEDNTNLLTAESNEDD